MATTNYLSAAALLAATLSITVLAGCPTVPGPVVPGSVGSSPTPSGQPAVTPAGTTPGAPASTFPATPPSGATPAPDKVGPSGLPSTPDTSSAATIQGIIFDDLGSRLDGVTVTGKILGAGTFANGSDTLSVTTQIGSYALNGAPTGATILVTAAKAGMTTRQQTIVPLSNLQGNTTLNRVSFGETVNGNADRVYPLSDKPEITSFTPAKDATGVDAATTFTLNFSEPVNTADVETRFAVYVAGPISGAVAGVTPTNTNASSYTLSASNTKLNYTYDPNRDDGSVGGTATYVRNTTAPVYDSASFTAAWSNNNQTVTFKFRTGCKLPTDKDASKLPQYAVAFKDGSIRDAAGTGRSDSWFRVSPAQVGRVGFKFTVAADTTAPQVATITATNADATVGATTADRIKVQFSKIMALYPGNMGGVSIPAATDTGFAGAVANYMYYVSPTGTTLYPGATVNEGTGSGTAPGTWQNTFQNFRGQGVANADAGGSPASAKVASGDAARNTVELAPRSGAEVAVNTTGASQGYAAGRNVWVNVASTVIDPAGNGVNTSSNINIRSGIAQ